MAPFIWGFVFGFVIGGGIGMLFAVRNKKIAKQFSDKYKEAEAAAAAKGKELFEKAKSEVKN